MPSNTVSLTKLDVYDISEISLSNSILTIKSPNGEISEYNVGSLPSDLEFLIDEYSLLSLSEKAAILRRIKTHI